MKHGADVCAYGSFTKPDGRMPQTDRLSCIMQDLNHLGVEVERFSAIDGTFLDYPSLGFVRSGDNPGHNGCLYSHTGSIPLTLAQC